MARRVPTVETGRWVVQPGGVKLIARILRSTPGNVGLFLVGYGVVGRILFPLISGSPRSARVLAEPSVDYNEILYWHLVAGCILLFFGCFSSRRSPFEEFQLRRLSIHPAAVASLFLPLLLVTLSGRFLLISRQEYIPDWPLRPIFLAGSSTASLAVIGLSAVLFSESSARLARQAAILGLFAYVGLFLAMQTREVGIPIAVLAYAYLRARRWVPRGIRAVGTLVVAWIFVGLAVSARAGAGEHGLMNVLSIVIDTPRAMLPQLDIVANVLNGFHASGAVIRSGRTIEVEQIVLEMTPLHLIAQGNDAPVQYNFGYRFPMPTLGLLASSGTPIFVGFFGGLGTLLLALDWLAGQFSLLRTAPQVLSVAAGAASRFVGLMSAIFLVQYTPSSVGASTQIGIFVAPLFMYLLVLLAAMDRNRNRFGRRIARESYV